MGQSVDRTEAIAQLIKQIPPEIWAKRKCSITIDFEVKEMDMGDELTPRFVANWEDGQQSGGFPRKGKQC